MQLREAQREGRTISEGPQCASVAHPLPSMQVFPPSFREPDGPGLDLFDLDDLFSSERVRLAQLTNKSTDDDLEYYIRECGEILGVPSKLSPGKRDGKHILEYIMRQVAAGSVSLAVGSMFFRLSLRVRTLDTSSSFPPCHPLPNTHTHAHTHTHARTHTHTHTHTTTTTTTCTHMHHTHTYVHTHPPCPTTQTHPPTHTG